ncbi:hypothetical protein CC79DRAFT_520848 [Sarocladium strictum]
MTAVLCFFTTSDTNSRGSRLTIPATLSSPLHHPPPRPHFCLGHSSIALPWASHTRPKPWRNTMPSFFSSCHLMQSPLPCVPLAILFLIPVLVVIVESPGPAGYPRPKYTPQTPLLISTLLVLLSPLSLLSEFVFFLPLHGRVLNSIPFPNRRTRRLYSISSLFCFFPFKRAWPRFYSIHLTANVRSLLCFVFGHTLRVRLRNTILLIRSFYLSTIYFRFFSPQC